MAGPPAQQTPPDLPPELANHPRYRILKELGRGGMGVVYQAEQTMMDRQVAVKVISKALLEHPDALERFHREVRAAAKLTHPNIVIAHDAERVGDLHMLVMEYVEGQSLAQVLQRKGPLAVAHACHFARQAALGLQHAFEHGMVHRDIKPHNLMLTPKGQVKILDFGLAKVASERGKAQGLTTSGAYMGTPDYCAPEQATDARSADIRADIYSLGCTLYCLLAGRPPFDEPSDVLTILAHLEKEPPPLPELHPDVPEELWAVVRRMLAKVPAERYQKPVEVAQALVPFIKQGSKGPPVVAAGTPAPQKASALPRDTNRPMVTREEARFDELTLEDQPRKPRKSTMVAPRSMSRWWLLAAGAAAAVLVLAVGAVLLSGVILRTRTPQGTVVLDIDHDGAEVDVDGQRWTVTVPGDREPIRIELPEGQHELRVTKGGFEAFTKKITIKSGKTEHIAAELVERVAAAPAPPLPPPRSTEKAPEPPAPPAKTSEPEARPSPGAPLHEPSPAKVWRSDSFFNGVDLTGWEWLPGYWSVKDGAIVGSTYPDGVKFNTFLCSKKYYTDFELKFQVRMTGKGWEGNSGVQIRSGVSDPQHLAVRGPQADMGQQFWGSLYGEQFALSTKQAPADLVKRVLKPKDFNDYYIKCVGKHVTIKLNGETTVDDDFPTMRSEGIIAWQLHAGQPMEVVFRNIQFTELAAAAAEKPFVSLFNGRDLTGWTTVSGQPARWKVVGGVLQVVPRAGDILTTRTFGPDLRLRAEFRIPAMPDRRGQGRGNSGIYLLGRHEIQIVDDFNNDVGGPERACGALYGVVGPNKHVTRPPWEWQQYDIEYHAPRFSSGNLTTRPGRLTVWFNSTKVIDDASFSVPNTLASPLRGPATTGPIGLQDHDAPVQFRNIEVQELPPTAGD